VSSRPRARRTSAAAGAVVGFGSTRGVRTCQPTRWLQPDLSQSLGRWHDAALELDVALANHGEREMRERRQITGRPNRALLRDDRMHAAIQQRQQQVERFQPDAGMAACQRVGADEHDGAGGGNVERVADAD
jgi:hypothetical protein